MARKAEDMAQMGDKAALGLLIGKEGMYKGTLIPMAQGERLTIGRDGAIAQLVVDAGAEKVSRRHCEVAFMGRDAGYLVTDFSRNGSFVEGGAKLPFGKAAAVECGATLCLGNRRNSFILTVTEL